MKKKPYVEHDLEKNSVRFKYVIWPQIQSLFPGFALQSMETIGNRIDRDSGIDHFLCRGTDLRGISARIHEHKKIDEEPLNTSTIRIARYEDGRKTEWTDLQKGRQRINKGLLRPRYDVQAYVTPNDIFISCGIMRHDNLIDAVNRHEPDLEIKQNRNGRGDSDFYALPWNWLIEWGYRIQIVGKERTCDREWNKAPRPYYEGIK